MNKNGSEPTGHKMSYDTGQQGIKLQTPVRRISLDEPAFLEPDFPLQQMLVSTRQAYGHTMTRLSKYPINRP